MSIPVCEHWKGLPKSVTPRTPNACEECLLQGTRWVHLRVCLNCGHVGCCDNSEGRHASTHFEQTGHPLIESLEPGETWRWCFIDRIFLMEGRPDR